MMPTISILYAFVVVCVSLWSFAVKLPEEIYCHSAALHLLLPPRLLSTTILLVVVVVVVLHWGREESIINGALAAFLPHFNAPTPRQGLYYGAPCPEKRRLFSPSAHSQPAGHGLLEQQPDKETPVKERSPSTSSDVCSSPSLCRQAGRESIDDQQRKDG